MAKTLMISNELYEELSKIKGEKSFTEVIKNLMDSKRAKNKGILEDCFGIIKDTKSFDKETKEIEKDLKRGWKNWSKKYV